MTKMRSTPPLAPAIVLAALAAACAGPNSGSVEPASVTAGTLAAGASAAHTLDLGTDMFVLAEVRQASVDVTVTVTDPSGATVSEVDGRERGIESFNFETEGAGTYEVTVAANDDEAGDYEFRLIRSEPIATDPPARLEQLLSPWDGSDRAGAIAAVVEDGEVAHVHAVGMANLSHGIPWDRGTISNIGSVSKQFTAMGLLLLEARGDISLDDDIRAHIPELPDFGEPITPRQLLNHTSGYREIYNLMRIDGFGGEDTFSREHAITVVQRQPELQNRPHTEWNYNNTGYILLSLLVERVTGQPFADYMRESVFEPVGMGDTRMKMVQGELIPGSAQGYTPAAGGGYRTTRDLPASAGAGGVYTTVGDLHRWLGNFHAPALGGPEAIEAMTTTAVLESGDSTGYGLGLGLGELRGRTLYSHTGGDVSHRAYLGYLPELNSGVILMSNNAGFNLGLGPDVVRLFFADDLEPEAEDGEGAGDESEEAREDDEGGETMSDERKAAIAGTWLIDVQGLSIPLEVTVEDGNVLVQFQAQNQTRAEVTSDSTIRVAQAGVTLTFRAAPDGTVNEGRGEQAGMEFALRRGERTVLAHDDLTHYVGRYLSQELEAFMEIGVEDGALVLRQLGQPDRALAHLADDTFTANETHLNRIRFGRAGDGSVTGFAVSNGRTRDVWFQRR